jgi:hypothetical protein
MVVGDVLCQATEVVVWRGFQGRLSSAVMACGSHSFLWSAMVARKEAGNCRCSVAIEKIGEDLLRLSSSTQTASSLSQSTAEMATKIQPPTRRPCLGPVRKFNLPRGGLVSVQSWELEAYSPRSDAFPVEIRWTMAATHHRKGAPELLAPAPRRWRLEDADERWQRCPGTWLQAFF